MISHPDILFKNEDLISDDNLEKLPGKERIIIRKKVESKIDKVQENIKSLELQLKKQNEDLLKYEGLKERIAAIIMRNI